MRFFAFANKLTPADRPPVDRVFDYYETATALGRATAANLLSSEPPLPIPDGYVTISNLKLREPGDDERFAAFLETVAELPHRFVVVPRHRLDARAIPGQLPANCTIDNRSGVLLDHFARSALSIHGNCITFDDSEHSPYESTFASNALVDADVCTKSQYAWLYSSGLTRPYHFAPETLERAVSRAINDPSVRRNLATKDAHVKSNAEGHINRFYETLSELHPPAQSGL